jgi:hypothetical protein
MEFTTEKRRELTSSVIKQNDMVLNSEKFSNNINSALGTKVEEDASNREVFLTLNSELTGLAYEYRYITGKYHPRLDEQEYKYIEATDRNEFIEKSYWDCQKLQDAAALREDNEFHMNLSEGSSDFYPTHPEKYSKWFDDDDEDFVYDVTPTEQEMFNTIRGVLGWFNSGGNSGHTQDLTIYNEFRTYVEGAEKQQYMTVGFLEYTAGTPTYMSDGYNPIGDLIYINKQDENNFCLAKIIDAKRQPSRILIAPFFIKGEIPNDAIITSNHTQGDDKYIKLSHELINELERIYKTIKRYLKNNPNKNLASNADMIENIDSVLELIKNFRDGDVFNVGRILGFVNDLEELRQPLWNNRIEFIRNFLTARESLYSDRFKIIDMRLSKRMGTLREMMKIETGITEVFRITNEKKDQVDWFKKYFIVRKCERDGDWKRRVFIIDPDNDFHEGDIVYLLTDNPKVPEIQALIDVTVMARLDDPNLLKVDEKTGEPIKSYYPVKKLFFKDAWKNGEVKLIRFFSDDYKTSEGFRVVKQVVTIEMSARGTALMSGDVSGIKTFNYIFIASGTAFHATGIALSSGALGINVHVYLGANGLIRLNHSIGIPIIDSVFIPTGTKILSGIAGIERISHFITDTSGIVLTNGEANTFKTDTFIFMTSGALYTNGEANTFKTDTFIFMTSGMMFTNGSSDYEMNI